MAAPTTVTPIWEQVIIEIDNTLGIVSLPSPGAAKGTVRLIGGNVTRVTVGQLVVFKTGISFSEGGATTWSSIEQNDIFFIFTATVP